MKESSTPVGGYFELELAEGEEYHTKAIRVNNARNALELAIQLYGYSKIFIPFYTCDVVLQPLLRNGIDYEFYRIDEDFYPLGIPELSDDSTALLYTNYFGICDVQVRDCVRKYKNLIIDNSQAFFAYPINGLPAFNSARKFFGVPDGAYLYVIDELLSRVPQLEEQKSHNHCAHLLKRIDLSAEEGYSDSTNNDLSMTGSKLCGMSKLSRRILESVNYPEVIKKRRENFNFVHQEIGHLNELCNDNIDLQRNVPLAYPFLFKHDCLKQILALNRIYIPTYWGNVLSWAPSNSREVYLTKYLFAIPIDQRYTSSTMQHVCSVIRTLVAR